MTGKILIHEGSLNTTAGSNTNTTTFSLTIPNLPEHCHTYWTGDDGLNASETGY